MTLLRSAGIGVGLLLWGLLAVAGAQQPAPAPQPPGGAHVYHPGDPGVTTPKVRYQARPQYTPEAKAQRIEGAVLLECIVEPDGSVGAVRVLRSLDATFGLDDAAVRAAKQWLFDPGLKDNVPVRVAVTLSIDFNLGSHPAAFTLPEAFEVEEAGAPGVWTETALTAGGMKVRVSLPKEWSVREPSAGGVLLSAQSPFEDAEMFELAGPAATSVDLQEARNPEQLERIAGVLSASIKAKVPSGQLVASGQGRLGDRTWVWAEFMAGSPSEMTAVAPPLPDSLRGVVKAMDDLYSGAHIWMFLTTVNLQRFSIACTAFVPRNGTDEQRADILRAAGRQFAQIISRLNIESQP